MFYVKGAQRGVYSSYRACLHATSDTKLRNGFDCEAPGIYCVTKRVAHPPFRAWRVDRQRYGTVTLLARRQRNLHPRRMKRLRAKEHKNEEEESG